MPASKVSVPAAVVILTCVKVADNALSPVPVDTVLPPAVSDDVNTQVFVAESSNEIKAVPL